MKYIIVSFLSLIMLSLNIDAASQTKLNNVDVLKVSQEDNYNSIISCRFLASEQPNDEVMEKMYQNNGLRLVYHGIILPNDNEIKAFKERYGIMIEVKSCSVLLTFATNNKRVAKFLT